MSISGRDNRGRDSAYQYQGDELKRGHKNAGLAHSEARGGQAGLAVDRGLGITARVKDTGLSAEVRIKPRMEALMESAYFVTHVALEQVRQKAERGESLDADDIRRIRSLVQSTVELSREERHVLAALNLDNISSEEIVELLSEMQSGKK